MWQKEKNRAFWGHWETVKGWHHGAHPRPTCPLSREVSTGLILPPRGNLAMSGDIFGCPDLGVEGRVLLVPGERRPGMPLSTFRAQDGPTTEKDERHFRAGD